MKIHYLSMILLFHSVIALGQNSDHKSGTITIQKATNSIEGLYGKMSIHSSLDQETNKDISQIKKNKSRFLYRSEVYWDDRVNRCGVEFGADRA